MTAAPTLPAIDGFRGKQLELTVPNLPVKGAGNDRRFVGCEEGTLKSWVGAIDT